MKPQLLFMAVALLVIAGCGSKSTGSTTSDTDTTHSAEGSWTMPNPDDSTGVIGVKLAVGGRAESINMPTLPYSSWQQSGDTVVLKGKSVVPGEESIPVVDTCIVKSDKMSVLGTDIVYTRK